MLCADNNENKTHSMPINKSSGSNHSSHGYIKLETKYKTIEIMFLSINEHAKRICDESNAITVVSDLLSAHIILSTHGIMVYVIRTSNGHTFKALKGKKSPQQKETNKI